MSGAAALLARVKKRKQELAASKSTSEVNNKWEWWNCEPSSTIYHPECVVRTESPPSPAVYLTKEEKDRQRKRRRLEDQELQRERIRLGIDPASEPKLKVKNAAAVFGPSFVNDPTHYELVAQQAEEARRNAHEQMNLERHLAAKATKHQKYAEKIARHKAAGIYCVALKFSFAVPNKTQFILDTNAKNFECTGVALLGENDAYVIMESGEQEIAKIEKLGLKLGAELAWKGPLSNCNFKRWSVHRFPERLAFLRLHQVNTMFDI